MFTIEDQGGLLEGKVFDVADVREGEGDNNNEPEKTDYPEGNECAEAQENS